ncbi:uncharacterized protein EDB93DRAFT_518746 [Suillus bovinus]|uniref:uncharacterized protein n=1 Tax=Suillus bovinus TaxID=48563 RepID=UPI001B86E038|nr:uncharacterized protein EDB93DRAFT_518746 [Suillus bovinus]KAG2145367.1 hypothetical protein EDB93DRAFT_518746 [Suillus bovinus]
MSSLSDYSPSELNELGIVLLQLNYANVAIACLLVYDYLTTIALEISYLFHGQWGVIKFLYLVCRYLPFVFVTLGIFMWVPPALSQTMSLCQTYYTLSTYIGGVILFCAECIFVTRTCVLWGYKRSIVVFFMISTAFYVVSTIVIMKMHASSTRVIESPMPSASCFDSAESDVIVAAYGLLILADLQIMFFSLCKATANFRNWACKNRLLEILIQHNIFYITCGLCSSVIVILTTALLQVSTSSLLEIYVDVASPRHLMVIGWLVLKSCSTRFW